MWRKEDEMLCAGNENGMIVWEKGRFYIIPPPPTAAHPPATPRPLSVLGSSGYPRGVAIERCLHPIKVQLSPNWNAKR